MPLVQVAQIFEQLNLSSAFVVYTPGRLIGRITIDDVVDVIRDQGEDSLMYMAGLAIQKTCSRRCLPWPAIGPQRVAAGSPRVDGQCGQQCALVALAGGLVLNTVTEIIGYVTFLGLGASC